MTKELRQLYIDKLISEYSEPLEKDDFDTLLKEIYHNEKDDGDVSPDGQAMFAVLAEVIPEFLNNIKYDIWSPFTKYNYYLTTIIVPEGTEELFNTFIGATELKKVKLPSTLKVIDETSFDGCTSLSEVIMGENVEVLGFEAFWGCMALKNIELPKTLKRMKEAALGNCGLTSLTIPTSVSNISDFAFFGCRDIESLTYDNKEGELKIGSKVFKNCNKLTVYTNNQDLIDYCKMYDIKVKEI